MARRWMRRRRGGKAGRGKWGAAKTWPRALNADKQGEKTQGGAGPGNHIKGAHMKQKTCRLGLSCHPNGLLAFEN